MSTLLEGLRLSLTELRDQGMRIPDINPISALADMLSDKLYSEQLDIEDIDRLLDELADNAWQGQASALADKAQLAQHGPSLTADWLNDLLASPCTGLSLPPTLFLRSEKRHLMRWYQTLIAVQMAALSLWRGRDISRACRSHWQKNMMRRCRHCASPAQQSGRLMTVCFRIWLKRTRQAGERHYPASLGCQAGWDMTLMEGRISPGWIR